MLHLTLIQRGGGPIRGPGLAYYYYYLDPGGKFRKFQLQKTASSWSNKVRVKYKTEGQFNYNCARCLPTA